MQDSGIQRFLRFCVVGTVGFITDGGLLQAEIHFLDLGPLAARVPSFLTAVIVTWYLNRNYTFRMPDKSFRESFPAYITANAVGLAINFGAYSACILLSPFMAQWPLIALAIASALALFLNFAAAHWVFRAPRA